MWSRLEPLAAPRTLDPIEVDALNLRWRDFLFAFRTHCTQGRQDFFQIDLAAAGHEAALFHRRAARANVGPFLAFSSGRPQVGQESAWSVPCCRIFQLARTAASKATCRSGTHLK
jgi:hypothetical protein